MRFSIPTPTLSAVEIGPVTIHAYALCIIAGVGLAIWFGNRRFTSAFPETEGVVADVALFAVPAGVIGGRIYHVLTSPELYFGPQGNPIDAIKIWNGGLGIWGAIAFGTLISYFSYCRLAKNRSLPRFRYFADALAPGVLIAQALGRIGNWFNGELFGRPLRAPWGLEIPPGLRPAGYENVSTFHPTFLYELIMCLAIAAIVIKLGERLPPGGGFIAYIFLYSLGRFFIEAIRIDSAHIFLGLRLNQYVAALLVIGSAATFTRIFPSKG